MALASLRVCQSQHFLSLASRFACVLVVIDKVPFRLRVLSSHSLFFVFLFSIHHTFLLGRQYTLASRNRYLSYNVHIIGASSVADS